MDIFSGGNHDKTKPRKWPYNFESKVKLYNSSYEDNRHDRNGHLWLNPVTGPQQRRANPTKPTKVPETSSWPGRIGGPKIPYRSCLKETWKVLWIYIWMETEISRRKKDSHCRRDRSGAWSGCKTMLESGKVSPQGAVGEECDVKGARMVSGQSEYVVFWCLSFNLLPRMQILKHLSKKHMNHKRNSLWSWHTCDTEFVTSTKWGAPWFQSPWLPWFEYLNYTINCYRT